MHMMHGNGSFWVMLFMGIVWLGLIIFGIYLTIHFIRGDQKTNHEHSNASLEMLKERLAKGEIDEAEYERLKSIILRDQ